MSKTRTESPKEGEIVQTKAKPPKLTDFPKNEEDPYANKLVTELTAVRRTRAIAPEGKGEIVRQYVVDPSSGEVMGQSAFTQFKEVDDAQFVKLFVKELAAFWELSKPAMRVLDYIFNNIPPNKNKVTFELKACMRHCQYKAKSQVFQGLADLLRFDIIARGETDWIYYINPTIAFNGDRVVFAKGIRRKRIESRVNEDQLELFGNLDAKSLATLARIEDGLDTRHIAQQLAASRPEVATDEH